MQSSNNLNFDTTILILLILVTRECLAKATCLLDSTPFLLELSPWFQCGWSGKLWKHSSVHRESEIFRILSLKMCFWKSLDPVPLAARMIFIVTLGIYLTQLSSQFYKSLLSSVYKEVKKTWAPSCSAALVQTPGLKSYVLNHSIPAMLETI